MRVTGTLIEIKNQQRMQSSYVEGETLYSRELGSQARRHGSRWNNYHLEPESNHFIRLSSPSLSLSRGVDGPANFIGCNDIICDDICPRYRDTVTLSDDGAICPGAGHQVWAAVPASQCSHWSLLSPLCSRPLISPSRVTHL